MTRQRRTFDVEFKFQVVKMIKEQGLRISQVCRDLDTGHRRDGRPPLDCPI
ncbi:transposase, partial [Laribacter hongkongensis]|nr:transposase [Laribacter hongkongensis]